MSASGPHDPPPGKADVVAIDGPVGVGKSTVARDVARELGFRHIDTGAMYRSVALRLLVLDEGERTPERAAREARELPIELAADGRVLLDGVDVTSELREERVGRMVHLAADNRAVREALVEQQRRLGRQEPSVLEGRDIGTIVFPDARWKFYLDADPAERVRRRVEQLLAAGHSVDPAMVERDLLDRDRRDQQRAFGALRQADDAVLVDSTDLSQGEVVARICAMVRGSGSESGAESTSHAATKGSEA